MASVATSVAPLNIHEGTFTLECLPSFNSQEILGFRCPFLIIV
jgi:hypothetical protein